MGRAMQSLSLFGWLVAAAAALPTVLACDLACAEGENKQGGACVAKSLERFDGKPQTMSVPWAAGSGVTIEGVHGDIRVSRGDSAEVVVHFEPFSYRAHDSGKAARHEMEDSLVLSAEAVNGVTISAARDGGSDGLGAHIHVELPAAFDGSLSVSNEGAGSVNPGNTDVEFVGSSPKVAIASAGIGDCTLRGVPSVVSTTVLCGGAVAVSGVADDVSIETTGLFTDSAVSLQLAAVGGGAVGGSVTSRDGDLLVTLPATGSYSVTASSPTLGEVQLGTPPSGCVAASAEPWTVSCGDGSPEYTFIAGSDGLGASNVVINYE
ncbi:MAG TPA: hypothetical protein PKA88_25960 [Polyangiaceae bacterium]|nr:hypothetical protein [Polyangiaceae bacterium]HMR79799.1 hypothetical protein [Polyangiaceae bacterium]